MFSIVHPCYGPHVDALTGYAAEGRYQKAPGSWEVLPPQAYHRMLSTYIKSLAEAGLFITHMVEQPREQVPEEGVPGLLYARCQATR